VLDPEEVSNLHTTVRFTFSLVVGAREISNGRQKMKHERRNAHDGADDSVRGEKGHVQKRPSTSMFHHSQETVQALTDALIELQMELRDRCHECEVLRATVETLSSELRTSDSSLEEAELRAEKLDFRLQAVSYCYQSDKQSKEGQQLLATDKESKKSKKKGKYFKREKSERKSKAEKKKDKKHKTSKSKAEREQPAEAECRDDINSEPRPESEAEPDPEPEPEVSSTSSRQAAFQSALWERDQAQAHARELADLLEESQLQRQTLTKQLDRMTALVELTYQDESTSEEELDTNTNVKRGFKWGTNRGPLLSTWTSQPTESRSRCNVSYPSSPDRAAGLAPHLVEI
jgi:hypothetical protein